MATKDVTPELHERVHSHTWWKVKTGWTDAQYVGRLNALLTRIREEWPDEEEEIKCKDLADGVEPLIATFDDRIWCLKGEEDEVLRFAEQLRLYTKWAEIIHSRRPKISEDEVYVAPTTTAAKAKKAELPAALPFEWGDVEVCLETIRIEIFWDVNWPLYYPNDRYHTSKFCCTASLE